ncbi:hypothetical protein [Polaromonas sp. CG9_12]|nr:hypothetical protein [Polaromonas sp. CG9_12]
MHQAARSEGRVPKDSVAGAGSRRCLIWVNPQRLASLYGCSITTC